MSVVLLFFGGGSPASAVSAVRVVATEQRWLAATIERPDGTALTFGPHEDDLGRVLTGTEFSTQIPGGFGNGMLRVARPERVDTSDIPLLASVRIYGPGNQTAYEGRVAAKPRFGATDIEVELEGWVTHLDDDETARENYVAAALEDWQGPSKQRQINHLDGGTITSVVGPEVEPDQGSPALSLNLHGPTDTGKRLRAEAWLDAGAGLTFGDLYYSYVIKGSSGTGDQSLHIGNREDDVATGGDETSDLYGSASGSGLLSALITVDERWLVVRWENTADLTTEGKDRKAIFSALAAYGSHGLTQHDSDSFDWPGVLGSDVVVDALGRWAPLLTVLDDDIETSSFVIPHLAFRELPNTARNIIEEATKLGGADEVPNDWGVYEGRRFFWRPPGSYGRSWTIRTDEGAEPADEGEDATPRCNGVIVAYRDSAGKNKTVGPTDSGADTETDELEDTDPTNPVNAAGITRRWRVIDAGTNFEDGAILAGRLALTEANRDGRRGAVTVPGPINDQPPWMLRAGDRVREESEPGASEETVVSTSYVQNDSYAVQANLGVPPHRYEVLLARLAALAGVVD